MTEALKTADFEVFRAMAVLGLLSSDLLPTAGVKALEAGVDTEAARMLAGLEKWDIQTKAYDLFAIIVDSLPEIVPSRAAAIFASAVAKAILTGRVDHFSGAGAIWDAVSNVPDTAELRRLDGFIYAFSEYEDRPKDRDFFRRHIESEARRLLIHLEHPDRLEYRIAREPAGERYRSLIDAGLRNGDRLLLVTRHGRERDQRAIDLLDQLQPYLIDVSEKYEWPGTLLLDTTATVYTYDFNFASAQILKDATDRLYNWLEPDLPEDPCILREDGTAWLTTITHEQYAGLNLTGAEYTQFKLDAPTLAKSLRKESE